MLGRRSKNLSANKRILQISNEPLASLSTSKDLPRLVKIFNLYNGFSVSLGDNVEVDQVSIQQQFPFSSSKTFVTEDEDDEDEKARLLYELLNSMFELLPQQCISSEFPLLSQFNSQVDLTNHDTLNQFLLNHFGEGHILVRLTKVLHQAVVIHVLVLMKQLMKSDNVDFKDVQGSWRIMLYFPNLASSSDSDQQDDANEIAAQYRNKICVCHRRKEQVYDKALNDLGKAYFRSLFQFEWEICIVYDLSGEVFDVFVKLLNVVDNDSIPGLDEIRDSMQKKKDAIARVFAAYNDLDYDQVKQQLMQPSAAMSPLHIQVTPPPQQENKAPSGRRGSISLRMFANLFKSRLKNEEKPENDVTRTYTPRDDSTRSRGLSLLSRLKRGSRSISEIPDVNVNESQSGNRFSF